MVQPPARVFEDVPVLCGHRGSGRGVVAGERENTLGSFRAAVAAGVRWVEVDVRAAADGVLVASHDPHLGDGRAIAATRAGETGLMRIEDLFEELPPEVGINLEIKSAIEDATRARDKTTAALTADLLVRAAGSRPVLTTAFDVSAPLIVAERAPGTPIGLLTWHSFPLEMAIPAALHLGMHVVAPHVRSFRLGDIPAAELARAVRVAHDTGLQVMGWCPDAAESEQLVAAGVDCLIVDDVPAATGSSHRAGDGR
jgi:glycerophosphoryl diester phosphodiesterase